MERLTISLPEDKNFFVGPSTDSDQYRIPLNSQIFIYPMSEQKLGEGSILLGVIQKGKVLSDKFFIRVVEGRQKQLEEALVNFEKLFGNNKTPSLRQKLTIMGIIEFAIGDSEVDGPESIRPA